MAATPSPRFLWQLIEPLHAIACFAPETKYEAATLGPRRPRDGIRRVPRRPARERRTYRVRAVAVVHQVIQEPHNRLDRRSSSPTSTTRRTIPPSLSFTTHTPAPLRRTATASSSGLKQGEADHRRVQITQNSAIAASMWKNGQPPGVDVSNRLPKRPEPDPPLVQGSHGVDQVPQGAAEPVEAPHHQGVPRPQALQDLLQLRTAVQHPRCVVDEHLIAAR